jgi:phage shock protein C
MSDQYKRLYRSRDNRMIAGVCGGLGEYFNIDPTLIRLLFVAAVFFGVGGGLLAYLIMMILVPEEPWPEATSPEMGEKEKEEAE